MAHDISTGTPSLSSITVPDNGDSATADSVAEVAQDVMNRMEFLRRPAADAAQKYPLASRTITRVVKHAWIPEVTAAWSRSSILVALIRTVDTSGTIVALPLAIPHGATVSNVVVSIRGAVGHTALPATKPSVSVSSVMVGSAGATETATVSDPSSTVAAYEAWHTITIPWTGGPVDNATKQYQLFVTPEIGANSVAGMMLGAASVTFTTTSQDDGAA